MYTKDKSTRVTLRLNDDQFEVIKDNSEMLGVSPSEFIRMMVNSSMAVSKKISDKLGERIGGRRANEETNIDDNV